MAGRIAVERRRELSRQYSRRLFDCPLWSVETAVCWIAFRDPACLAADSEAADNLIKQADCYPRDCEALVESQPEIVLLIAL